jgi:ferredoxin-NADP reductase
MARMTFTGTLLEKIPRLPDTSSYRFSRPAGYAFKPGQFFSVTIASADGPLTHHFSHADSPTEKVIELTTRLTGSPFKNALDALPVGAEVQIEGPMGLFLFKPQAPRICFLTGGIGLTPVRSMLKYLADTGGPDRVSGQEILLLFGSMTEDGVLYRDQLDEFARIIPGLRVVHVITKPTESWKGYSGFITADIVRAEIPSPVDWEYYVVGPPPMIDAMWKVIHQLEIPDNQVLVEGFTGYVS